MTTKAAFIDRDGVLNKDSHYVHRLEDLVVLDGVSEALRILKDDLGYLLLVITNQSGVSRGLFSLKQVHAFNKALQENVSALGGPLVDDFFVCPHHPKGKVAQFAIDCSCRKPKTGLVDLAKRKWDIDLSSSFVIGDKASDIELGHNLQITSFQVQNDQYPLHPEIDSSFVVPSLLEAAKILRTAK